ncbi:MAG: class I SAM-dependent methyltransferase [Acidobacteriota bacterium]
MVSPQAFSFDRGAAHFDQRAGLPPRAIDQIAAEVVGLMPSKEGTCLDLGAGTGEIGAELGRRLPPGRYVGLDLSLPMLQVFRRRAPGLSRLRGDASLPWPIADASLDAIFVSRAAHLLRPEGFCREVKRTLSRGGLLLLGGVARDRVSIRSQLRRKLQEVLAAEGIDGRRRSASWRRLRERLEAMGCRSRRLRIVSWPVAERAIDSISSWRRKDGLAGRPVTGARQQRLLDQVEHWATASFGDLATSHAAEETYELLVFNFVFPSMCPPDSSHKGEP